MMRPRASLVSLLGVGTLASLLLIVASVASELAEADDVLARSRATYAALRTYADTGTVDVEYGQSGVQLRERHSFKTFYRGPRNFYFDFTKANNTDRYVVWSDDAAFHSWWKATGVAQTYPKGQGAMAFALGASPTSNSLLQIAPLLFAKAGLAGTLSEFGDASATGIEKVGGRSCHKLVGVARSQYQGSGRVTSVRPTTVWIDAETLLVRKVLEDRSEGSAVSRVTTTFEPRADPVLDDGVFRFTPPGGR